MSDLISRQAAIDSFRYDDDGTAWTVDDIVYRLEQFPSAGEMQSPQPEYDLDGYSSRLWKAAYERGKQAKHDDIIYKIVNCVVETGQNDTNKFKLGETIRYSPSELLNILKAHKAEIFKGE